MPIPACSQPVTITAENWTTHSKQVIISYLDEYGILWIFYEIMSCGSSSEASKYRAMMLEANQVGEPAKCGLLELARSVLFDV
jgi:hypothetical protein